MRLLGSYVRLARPHQWTKNLLVLAALVFAAQLQDIHQGRKAFLMFVAFCLVSSAVYVVNDVMDRAADRLHPRKMHRPVAAGKSGPQPRWLSLCCFSRREP